MLSDIKHPSLKLKNGAVKKSPKEKRPKEKSLKVVRPQRFFGIIHYATNSEYQW